MARTYNYSIPIGSTVVYSVTKNGYISYNNTITNMREDYSDLNISLEIGNVTLTVTPTPSDATVLLVADGYTQVGNSITVRNGTSVTYVVSKTGYRTVNNSMVVTSDTTVPVEILETLVYKFDISGEFSGTLAPDRYRVLLSGAGGGSASLAVGASVIRKGGNAELSEQTITITSPVSFSGVVASGRNGYVNGSAGELGKVGNVLYCSGGDGGGQSRFYINGIIDLRADGGGGAFGSSGTALNAKGGNGSGGALGGQSRSAMDGADAGNGLGASGSIEYGKNVSPTGAAYTKPAERGYCIIERV